MTRNNKSKLSHVWHFQELQDGELLSVQAYDAVMATSLQQSEEIEEGFAAVKAQLSIRAQRAKKA